MSASAQFRVRVSYGFTFVELVAVIVLFGIIAAMTASLMGQGFTAYVTGRNIAETDWQARVALERMTRELRSVRAPADITMTSAADLTVVDAEGNSIRYCMGTVGTCPGAVGELMRNAQPLAKGVTALTFTYLTKGPPPAITAVPAQVYYIIAAFTATQGTISKNFQVAVSPRNFP
jgi:prepilin-type N-terminal cleavage/methylation domain-containing protein